MQFATKTNRRDEENKENRVGKQGKGKQGQPELSDFF
jgi:hypothetical protein